MKNLINKAIEYVEQFDHITSKSDLIDLSCNAFNSSRNARELFSDEAEVKNVQEFWTIVGNMFKDRASSI